ncbi:MAG: ABC transporter permease [Candidatus Omnitrophica bacterium]|nr:ABC transporter permease [Candidatus Omnitrophota bacterium]
MIIAEVKESFLMAMSALAAHKLRSALTLLGVLVGVFSIIIVMTAMRALQNVMETELSQLGAQTFIVSKWPAMFVKGPEDWEKYWRRLNIRYPVVLQLKQRATLARSVGAETWLWHGEVSSRYATTNPDIGMRGITPEIFSARNLVIEQGRGLLESDLESTRSVCVLGSALAKKLFPYGSPIDENVKFHGVSYLVVGVLAAKGAMLGGDQDNFLLAPLTTGLNRFGWDRSLDILVQARNQAAFDDTVEQVRGILRTLRKVPPGAEDDFEINSNDSLIQQFKSLTLAVRIGVTVVSSIALLAAGVGIMNIMLVSVTERTREIGIRRAVGAKKRNIMTQFIMEAISICQVGGVIGVLLGIGGGNLAALYLKVPPVIPFDWVLIGLVICSLVGIIFGTYPAYKAANLDPIESLRYE